MSWTILFLLLAMLALRISARSVLARHLLHRMRRRYDIVAVERSDLFERP